MKYKGPSDSEVMQIEVREALGSESKYVAGFELEGETQLVEDDLPVNELSKRNDDTHGEIFTVTMCVRADVDIEDKSAERCASAHSIVRKCLDCHGQMQHLFRGELLKLLVQFRLCRPRTETVGGGLTVSVIDFKRTWKTASPTISL